MKTEELPFFSYEELVALAQKSLDHRGRDYVYPRGDGTRGGNTEFGQPRYGEDCVYMFEKNKPGCIVGDMLYTANMITDLPIWNQKGVVSIVGYQGYESTPEEVFKTTAKGKEFLEELQRSQDDGESWGDAFDRAVAQAELEYPK